MKAMTKKLKSSSGASMIMALLLLLVASTASAIIIASAQSAARNVAATEKHQRAYLSVSSAAEYIAGEIKKVDVLRREKTDADLSYTYTVDADKTQSAFGPEINKILQEQFNPKDTKEKYTDVFYISVPGTDEKKLLPVKATLEMNKTYDITIHLSVVNSDNSEFFVKVMMLSKMEQDSEDSTKQTITWPYCTINKESHT